MCTACADDLDHAAARLRELAALEPWLLPRLPTRPGWADVADLLVLAGGRIRQDRKVVTAP